jgi:hypothetical protein
MKTVVKAYVESKSKMTRCMGKHFRQVCHNCPQYFDCKVYLDYYDAWIKLQGLLREDI